MNNQYLKTPLLALSQTVLNCHSISSLGIQALLSSENTELGAGKISMVQFDVHSL